MLAFFLTIILQFFFLICAKFCNKSIFFLFQLVLDERVLGLPWSLLIVRDQRGDLGPALAVGQLVEVEVLPYPNRGRDLRHRLLSSPTTLISMRLVKIQFW